MSNETSSAAEDQQGTIERRRWTNFFVKPRFQLRYVNWFITGAFITLAGTVAAIHYRLQPVDHLLNAPESLAGADPSALVPLYSAFSDITLIALAGLVIFAVWACALALLMNHRIAGPMIAIVDILEKTRQGNYRYDRQLRNNDELMPIYEAASNLQKSLREEANQKLTGRN